MTRSWFLVAATPNQQGAKHVRQHHRRTSSGRLSASIPLLDYAPERATGGGSVADQARDAAVRAKQLQDLQSEWRTRLAALRASARASALLDELFDLPVLTIPQAQRRLGVSYPGAQHIIERLVEAGIINQAGDSRYGKTYVANDILRTVAV